MADDTERTEDATPRKKARLHSEGSVPRSQDIGTAAVLLIVTPAAAALGDFLVAEVMEVAQRMFRLADANDPLSAIGRVYQAMWIIAAPVSLMTVVTFAVGVAQARVFSFKPLELKLDRLNPFPNFKKIVPGKETAIELAKQMTKLLAVGLMAYSVIAEATPLFTFLPSTSVPVTALSVGTVLKKLLLNAGIAFAVISIFDYLLAVRKFNEDAKMSKDEVRDERKQEDVSPEVRQQRRRRMAELLKGGPAAVRNATVVVTNPTHYAIALRYENEIDDAPLVLAKGVGQVALDMRSEARKHQVPIVENRPLARALYVSAKVGQTIPLEFYRGVAEVIAFVMQLRTRRTPRAVTGGNR